MVSLTDANGEFIGFFDSDGEALVYATVNGVASPFKIVSL